MHTSYKKWLDDGCPKVYCICGCNQEIIIKKHHKRRGIPKYVKGHNRKNRPLSEEHRRKIKENHADLSGENHYNFGKHLSEEHKQKISDAKIGGTSGMLGKHQSKETKQKIRNNSIGDKNSSWKGGITVLNVIIRNSNEYDIWRLMIFGRDNFTCQCCGVRGKYLEAHHIKPFNEIIKEYNIKNMLDASNCSLLWDLDNGITYCTKCHNKLKKKGGTI